MRRHIENCFRLSHAVGVFRLLSMVCARIGRHRRHQKYDIPFSHHMYIDVLDLEDG